MSRLASTAGRGCEQALAVEDLEDAGHAAHVAVEVRHVVGQRVEVERPPRRRHLLNRSDRTSDAGPNRGGSSHSPPQQARRAAPTRAKGSESREVAEQETAAAAVAVSQWL